MTFTWDFNTATLVAIGVQIIIFIVYLVKTNGTAKEALAAAGAADERAGNAYARADEAHEKITLVHAALALHREHVAREYHDKEELRQMETRLGGLIRETETRLASSIAAVNARLDERQ